MHSNEREVQFRPLNYKIRYLSWHGSNNGTICYGTENHIYKMRENPSKNLSWPSHQEFSQGFVSCLEWILCVMLSFTVINPVFLVTITTQYSPLDMILNIKNTWRYPSFLLVLWRRKMISTDDKTLVDQSNEYHGSDLWMSKYSSTETGILWGVFISAVCCGFKHMFSLVPASVTICCPWCSKLAPLKGTRWWH